jgi:hypothetical protein
MDLKISNLELYQYSTNFIKLQKDEITNYTVYIKLHLCVQSVIGTTLNTLYFLQPFFAPVSLHVLLAAIKELKRYKAE